MKNIPDQLFSILITAAGILGGFAFLHDAYQFFGEFFLQLILESLNVERLLILGFFIVSTLLSHYFLLLLGLGRLVLLLVIFFLLSKVFVESVSLFNEYFLFFHLHLLIVLSPLLLHPPPMLLGLVDREFHYIVDGIHRIFACSFIYNNKDENSSI